MAKFLRLSVIVPCFNEAAYVDRLLVGLAEQDYPKDRLEILLVDGGSTDGTRERIEAFVARHPFMKLVHNPARIAPVAMNIGLERSQSELVAIIGAHAAYPSDYFSKQAHWLEILKADCVGGMMRTEAASSTPVSTAIAGALTHPFGVGNGHHRTGAQAPREVDCVAFGCYRRTAFERVGGFDERLVRNQDMELFSRLKRAGCRVWLAPQIAFTYFCRPSLSALFTQHFATGKWVVLASRYTRTPRSLSPRHFVPLAFVIYLLAATPLAAVTKLALLPAAVYASLLVASSVAVARRKGAWSLAPWVGLSFVTLHFAYGLGSLAGLFAATATVPPSSVASAPEALEPSSRDLDRSGPTAAGRTAPRSFIPTNSLVAARPSKSLTDPDRSRSLEDGTSHA